MKPTINCVLLIDDDEPTNFFTNIILEESGFVNHVRTMQSGQEALDYISKSECGEGKDPDYPCPDLIFLDINMPVMDGWEFLTEYRKLKMKERVIVVMLTTSLFPEDKQRADGMVEISGFENKPLTVEKLTGILNQYFASEKLKQNDSKESQS